MSGIDFDSWQDYVPVGNDNFIDIESLARQAINRIKSTWGMPKSGFIAGGSIANIMWELVSGNKAIVNDIDVFINIGKLTAVEAAEITSTGRKLSYVNKDITWHEDYNGLSFACTPTEYYQIESVDKEGMYNHIYYKSSVDDLSVVIKSFDINCTSIGYSIEEDKFYWNNTFEDFLKTGEIKVTNLTTPCHTVIRMTKKQDELNAKLDDFEYLILDYAISHRFLDLNKNKFSTRYHDLFKKYKDKFPDYIVTRLEGTENYLKSKGIDIELYTIESHPLSASKLEREKKYDENVNKIYNSQHFLFYMRNIFRNERLKSIWEKTNYFFTNEDYIDVTVIDNKSLDLLSKVAQFAPNTIENLRGYRLSSQLDFIGKLFDKFKDDPLVGISILERHKMGDIDLDDDKSLLILELTVRKNLIDDPRSKVDNILGRKEEKYSELDNLPDLFL